MADLEKKEAVPSHEGVLTPPSPSPEPSDKEQAVDTQVLNEAQDVDPPRTIHGVKVCCIILPAPLGPFPFPQGIVKLS